MGLFSKNKEEMNLEQMAREAIIARGIKIDPSFKNPDYISFNVIGIGETETDSEGALKRFREYLKIKSPEVVSLIKEDLTPHGLGGRKKRVYAVGYKLNSPIAA